MRVLSRPMGIKVRNALLRAERERLSDSVTPTHFLC
jgi:hypothetical protein